MAPTVDTSASSTHPVPPSPGRGLGLDRRKVIPRRGVERSRRQVSLAISSRLPACPCEGRDPSPFGEGTRGLGVRARPPKQANGPASVAGLSRFGVSDENAMQRGSSRIGQPIRGPDAEQARQPKRDQPGGFFRPLFGRSKRGHPDGGASTNRRYQCPSTHPVPPSPGR
jgi:hypothetical protein